MTTRGLPRTWSLLFLFLRNGCRPLSLRVLSLIYHFSALRLPAHKKATRHTCWLTLKRWLGFVYITTQCLEAPQVKCLALEQNGLIRRACSGPPFLTIRREQLWRALRYLQHRGLKDTEAYLIGRFDASLFVRVDRLNNSEEPRLLVFLSTIPLEYLHRLGLKGSHRD